MGQTWKSDSEDIFERFASGIDEAISTGQVLKCADRDVQYSIRLQNERMRKHGLRVRYNLSPRGNLSEGFKLGRIWSDEHYENKLESRTCLKDEEYYEGERRVFRKKENAVLHQTVTSVRDGVDVSEDIYCCPDCGAPTRISQLTGGCPSCGNKFRMSELYPKISNYYFYPDVGSTRKEMGRIALPSILISVGATYLFLLLIGVAGLIGSTLTSHGNAYQSMQAMGNFIGIAIGGIFIAGFYGAFTGWIITVIIYLVRFGKFAAQRIPMAKYLGSQKSFEEFMKKSTPEFSYEFFAGKAVNYIKMILLSDNPQNLPFYYGQQTDPSFENIVDVESMGAVGVTKVETSGNYAVVYADVYLENTYHSNGKVVRINEVFETVMRKNLSRPVSMNFHITSIHCPTCGGSFDATRSMTCPYCSNSFRMEDLDWSVDYLVRKAVR